MRGLAGNRRLERGKERWGGTEGKRERGNGRGEGKRTDGRPASGLYVCCVFLSSRCDALCTCQQAPEICLKFLLLVCVAGNA